MGWWELQVYQGHRESQEDEDPMGMLGREDCQVNPIAVLNY